MKKILVVTLLCLWAVIGYGQSQAFNAEVLYSQEMLGYNTDVKHNKELHISESEAFVYMALNANGNSVVIIKETPNVLSPIHDIAVTYINAEYTIDKKHLEYLFDIHQGLGGYSVMYKGCFVYATSSDAYMDMCNLIDGVVKE